MSERTLHLVGRIWRDVLGVGPVPADADLLDLGGDSLTAEWIAARVRGSFPGAILSGRDVLVRTPTVAAIARLVGPHEPPLALSSQQAALLGRTDQSRRAGLPMRAFNVGDAIRLRGPLDVPALRTALEQLVHHQAALRCGYDLSPDRTWRVRLHPPRPFVLPVTDEDPAELNGLTGRLVDLTNVPFAPDDAVRLRAHLLRTDVLDHVLVLVMDHIVGDGFSLTALHRELGRRYGALTGSGPAVDGPPTHAFLDFVAAQRTASIDRAADLAFWRETLGAEGVVAHTPLPFERDLPATAERAARTIEAGLPAHLDETARAARSTRFRLILAALAVVLRRVTGQDRSTVLSPDANRDAPELAGVIGWISHLVPYHTDLSGDPALSEVLRRVHDTVLNAQSHKQVTYHDVIRAVRPDKFGVVRSSTWINLVASEPDALRLPGIGCDRIAIPGDAPYRALEIQVEDDRLRVTFDLNRFPEPAVADLLDELIQALDRFAGDPSRRLSASPRPPL